MSDLDARKNRDVQFFACTTDGRTNNTFDIRDYQAGIEGLNRALADAYAADRGLYMPRRTDLRARVATACLRWTRRRPRV